MVTSFLYFLCKHKQVANISADHFCIQLFFSSYTQKWGPLGPHHTEEGTRSRKKHVIESGSLWLSLSPEGNSLIITDLRVLSSSSLPCNSEEQMMGNFFKVILTITPGVLLTLGYCKIILLLTSSFVIHLHALLIRPHTSWCSPVKATGRNEEAFHFVFGWCSESHIMLLSFLPASGQ